MHPRGDILKFLSVFFGLQALTLPSADVSARVLSEEELRSASAPDACGENRVWADFDRFAEEVGASAIQALCDDPYRFICDGSDGARHQEELKRLERKRGALRGAARAKLAKRYGYPRDMSERDLIEAMESARGNGGKGSDAALMTDSKYELEGTVAGLVAEELGGFPDLALVEPRRSRNFLKEAIGKSPSLPAEVKARMQRAVDEVRVVTAAETASILKTDWRRRREPGLYGPIQMVCGKDGLEHNSLLVSDSSVNPPRAAFVSCPGWVIASRKMGLPLGLENSEEPNTWLNAHEYGHSVDSWAFPDVFAGYLDCVYSKLGAELDIKSRLRGLGYSEKDADEKVVAQKREITGDYWASEVLASRLAEKKNARERLRLAVDATAVFCRKEPEASAVIDVHPSVQVRVNQLIFGNPGVRKALGCAPRSGKSVGCEL